MLSRLFDGLKITGVVMIMGICGAVKGEVSDGLSLNTVTITATRSKVSLFDSPFSESVVDRRTLDEQLFRTVPQAFRDIPGVMIQETGPGQGSPYIRGFTGHLNLMMVDGIRLNNSVFRPGPNQYWNTIDMGSIDRFEVVKGPSSVLYGSDAIGGTVNAVTKSPYSYGKMGGKPWDGLLTYRLSSAENSHAVRGEFSAALDERTGILIGGGGSHFGDLIGGRDIGRQEETGYDQWSSDVKFERWITDDVRFVAAHYRLRQNNAPRTHRTIFAESFEGTSVGSELQRDLDQERELTYLMMEGSDLDGAINAFRITVSYQRQSESRHRIRPPSGMGVMNRVDFQGFSVDTVGVSLQMESKTKIGRLVYGIEYYRDSVNSFSSSNPIQGPVGDDASYDLLGIFIQNQIKVGERLTITIGGRFNYAKADADSVRDPDTSMQIGIEDSWTSWVGSVRFVYELVKDEVNLFGGISQGFRAPNFSDLTRFDSARSNEFETPAVGLDPEYYLSYEIGVKVKKETWSLTTSFFYTDIRDQIVRFPTGAVIDDMGTMDPSDDIFEVTKSNVGDGEVYGVELGAAWRFHSQWTVFGNVTFLEGEVDTFPTATSGLVSEYIDRNMPLTGQVGLRWDDPSGKLWGEGVVMMAGKADKLSTRDTRDTGRIPPGGTPSYAVLHLRGGVKLYNNVDLVFAVENVFDEDYRVHGSGQNMVGRNFVLSVRAKF